MFVKANNAKSCPMCGSQDIYIEEFDRDVYKAIHIQCIKCGLRGFKDFTHTEKNPIEKTIEYWNTRSKSVLYIRHLFIITFIKGLLKRKRW